MYNVLSAPFVLLSVTYSFIGYVAEKYCISVLKGCLKISTNQVSLKDTVKQNLNKISSINKI